jgi:hypothetical protein
MLWSLISSAYVIFLYRKLNAEVGTLPAVSANSPVSLDEALEALDQRLAALEARLAVRDKATIR